MGEEVFAILAFLGALVLITYILSRISLEDKNKDIAIQIPRVVSELSNKNYRFLKELNFSTRICFASIILWVIGVPIFVFTLEPYGTYINSTETSQFLKLIFIPPIFFILILFVYRKIVRLDFTQKKKNMRTKK